MPKLVSRPSSSVFSVNAPEVKNFSCNFVYKFYEKNERVNEDASFDIAFAEYARYNRLSWSAPASKVRNTGSNTQNFKPVLLKNSINKVVSEENSSFNKMYISHTFSDIKQVENGLTSFKNFTRINGSSLSSVSKNTTDSIKNSLASYDATTSNTESQQMYEDYLKEFINRLPVSSLSLRVFDDNGNLLNDEGDLFRSIIKDTSLDMKIRTSILPDIFNTGQIRTDKQYEYFKNTHELAVKNMPAGDESSIFIEPVSVKDNVSLAAGMQSKVIGYIIEKYLVTSQGFVKKNSIYIESSETTSYVDTKIAYGVVYAYTIQAVVSVRIFAEKNNQLKTAYVYVASKKSNAAVVRCFEYIPPPPPENIKFHFDNNERRLHFHWETPVNKQRDIKQFQIFRRQHTGHPFELIKQIGFDESLPGFPNNEKYRTGEIVDYNIPEQQRSDIAKQLITDAGNNSTIIPYVYRDPDFTVDDVSSDEFIYALASVDAHGMISNYSEQYRVKLNTFTKRLMVDRISEAGAPRQYPNMLITEDLFKDSFSESGDAAQKISITLAPTTMKMYNAAQAYQANTLNAEADNLLKREKVNAVIDVVKYSDSTTDVNEKPYYLLQLLNLDNQKTQDIKVFITS